MYPQVKSVPEVRAELSLNFLQIWIEYALTTDHVMGFDHGVLGECHEWLGYWSNRPADLNQAACHEFIRCCLLDRLADATGDTRPGRTRQ